MQIRWTEEASDSIEQTLDYWYRNNGTFTYSEKILNETEKVQKEILSNPYSKQYSDILDVYRKSFFKGKFSLYYKIDEAEQIIWITDFRSNKQRPLF